MLWACQKPFEADCPKAAPPTRQNNASTQSPRWRWRNKEPECNVPNFIPESGKMTMKLRESAIARAHLVGTTEWRVVKPGSAGIPAGALPLFAGLHQSADRDA